jgi:Cellulase (glycosyl hydrolase family 5)
MTGRRPHVLYLVCALAYLLICGPMACGPSVSRENPWFFARGINLSGGELNPERKPAVYGKDYIYPTPEELDYYASKGFTVVRLPYRWERLQPSLLGSLDSAELGRIKKVLAAARARKMQVILSPHNGAAIFSTARRHSLGRARYPLRPLLIPQARWLLLLPATKRCMR